MHLFYIRNYFSILTAETIIKKNNLIAQAIAYILDNNIENYYQNIKTNMNSSLWREIKSAPISEVSNENNKIVKLVKLKKSYFRDAEIIKEFLIKDKISQIYLSCIFSPIERLIYDISQSLNIIVNFYEESPLLYGLDKFSNYFQITDCGYCKYLLRTLLEKGIFAPEGINYYFYNIQHYKVETVYCYFPDKYKLKNFKNKVKIDLNFDLSLNEKALLGNFEVDILFLSRPISEDKIISFKEEVKILGLLLKQLNHRNIFVKFHPRESKTKIDNIKKLNIKEVPDEYKHIPAEKLALCGKISMLIGYETTTLAYISELSNIEVYSLLEKIYFKSKHFEMFYTFYKDSFKKIKYFDLCN